MRNPRTAGAERGGVLAVFLHVILVLLVLGQVVYLASRYRLRVDMTSDKLWTSTNSTRNLIDKLEEKLVVEAYFSPKDRLPVSMSGSRDWADNFLDELVQLGKGRVVVQRFDPNSDKAIADTAVRLGIKPLNLRRSSATSLSLDQHWQGLRLLYGGGKQKVLEAFLPTNSFQAEALVAPRIKEVMTRDRRRFGYMEWPATKQTGRQPGGVGWSRVRTHEGLKSRYEFQNVKDEDGALLPDEFGTLFLFRPSNLSDRQRYVIDQFLMGGGTLVIFADAAEYSIGQQRLFRKVPLAIDAPNSETSFLEQLRHYGIEWKPRIVADMQLDAYKAPLSRPNEYLAVPMRGPTGMTLGPVQYPYFFHPMNIDWRDYADQLAKDVTGKVDERLAEQYRKTLQPGMPFDDFLFAGFKKNGNRGPGFYWPTWTGLRERAGGIVDLPDGIEGRVMLWSSPLALLEDPPFTLDPIGQDPQQWNVRINKFIGNLNERLKAEARQQAPLMAEVKGEFTSYFAGRDRPKRPSQIEEDKRKGAEDSGSDKAAGGDEQGAKDVGPQPAAPAAAQPVEQERKMRTEALAGARVVVVGDATFLRDDVLTDYAKIGGPVSGQLAMPFFAQLLDWLSDDDDLVELQSRVAADRTMSLVDSGAQPNSDPRNAEQALRSKTSWLIWLNVIVPCLLLSLFGVALWLVRRNQKRAFLASLPQAAGGPR